MKKRVWIVMLLLAALALTACGADKTAAPVEPAADVVVEETPAAEEVQTEEPTKEVPAEPTPLELAKTFIDGDLALLVEALGEPVEASYETSCMGDGDDGILTYDGFTVYTYLDTDGTETVLDVE